MVSGLRGSRFPPALVVSALPPAGGGAPLSLGRQQSGRHWRRAVHGGRGPPYHSGSRPPGSLGTICAVSRCAGVGPLVLRGPHLSRRLGRGGGSHSGSPLGRGGSIPSASGGGGRGPRGWRAGGGAGGGGGVAPRPPCSRSGRRPAVLLSGSLRAAGALPSGARVRTGLKCRPGVGGVRGGPWTAPLGAPSDLKPPLCHLGVGCGYGRVMWGAASFLFRCARCSGTPAWVRGSRSSRRCPYCVAVPPEGGAPPRPWGGGGPRLWLPCCGGRGGGGWGGRPPARPRVCVGGGGGLGGAWQSWPRGPAIGQGVAPFSRPPLSRAGFPCRPSPGPLISRPLSRGAGRPGVAVRVSGQWLAGCGAAGSPPRSLSPQSLPREVARPRTSCHTVGGAWVGGLSPPPPNLPYPPSGPSPAPPLVAGLGLRRRRVVPAVAPVGEGATQGPGEPVVGVRIRDAEHRSPFQEGRPRRLPVGPRRPDH